MSETWYCDDHVDLRAAECPMCLTERNAALTLRAEKAEAAAARVRIACEQQVMDRSPYSDDRHKHGLDRIDGWNDALEMVEDTLDETEVTA